MGKHTYVAWRIVGLAAIAIMLTGPGQTIGASVYVDDLIADLDLTRSEVSLAYLYGTLGGATALSFVGRTIDRFGVRYVMAGTGVLFGFAIAAMSGVVGFVSLVLGFTGVRLLGQGVLNLTATTSVAFWFEKRRGLALGVTTAVGAGLMSLVPLIINYLIGAVGWRASWLVMAPVVAALIVAIALIGMRNQPGEVGLAVDRERSAPHDNIDETPTYAPAATRAVVTQYKTLGEAIRSGAFWAIAAVVSSNSLIITGLLFHQISVLGEQGLTPSEAAVAFVPLSLASLCATFAAGAMVDRFSARVLLMVAMCGLMGAMFFLPFVTPGLLTVLYAILIGASTGMIKPIEATVTPRMYGLKNIGSIRGVLMSINVTASALGPYLLAVGFDRFQAYAPALSMLAILPVSAIIFLLTVHIPKSQAFETV